MPGGVGAGVDAADGLAGGMDQDGAIGVPADERALGVVGVVVSLRLEATGVAGHWVMRGGELPSVTVPPGFVVLAGRTPESDGLLAGPDASAVEVADGGVMFGIVAGRGPAARVCAGEDCLPPQH
jgi:hypothetical protein